MRKLMFLALAGGAAAYFLKNRDQQSAPSAATAGGGFEPTPADTHAEEVAEAEATPEEAAVAEPDAPAEPEATADTVESDAVVPDTSADDPVVRQQENAAAAEAADIGGEPDTVTADADPEMRPVIEGSGDAAETFEETEDQGR
jgi:hypothetical protein